MSETPEAEAEAEDHEEDRAHKLKDKRYHDRCKDDERRELPHDRSDDERAEPERAEDMEWAEEGAQELDRLPVEG